MTGCPTTDGLLDESTDAGSTSNVTGVLVELETHGLDGQFVTYAVTVKLDKPDVVGVPDTVSVPSVYPDAGVIDNPSGSGPYPPT